MCGRSWNAMLLNLNRCLVHVFLVAVLFCTASCNRCNLLVYTDYLSHQNLASYFVGTPDPNLNHPPIGQRVIIIWTMPSAYMGRSDIWLEVKVRFRNNQEANEVVQLTSRSGTYVYSLMNRDYIEKKGILAYKISMYAGACVIDTWKHQLWVDLISFAPVQQKIGNLDEFNLPPPDPSLEQDAEMNLI